MRYHVTIDDRTLVVDLSGSVPRVQGEDLPTELVTRPGSSLRSLLVRGRSYSLVAEPTGRRGEWSIFVGPRNYAVRVVDERTRVISQMTAGAEVAAPKTVVAPMPGMVVRVDVVPGQQVRAGEGVVVVEAMKMENELRTPADGVVLRVEVAPGATVEKGAVLVVFK
jgi:biotin carboxyl carrier protein